MISQKLTDDEKIIVTIRKHWIVFAFQAFIYLLALLLPIIIVFSIPASAKDALLHLGLNGAFILFIYTLFALFVWVSFFVSWTTYFLDTWVVTNMRVIDVAQQTLFQRDITTLMLEKIQDVTVEIRGIFPTLFGYGTLILRTAGEGEDVTIRYASHPQTAKDLILRAQEGAVHTVLRRPDSP